MEPILIYTDAAHVDAGAIQTFEMDLAFGADEQDFEIAFPSPTLSGGELLYIDGTEYGGIVDVITQSTETDNIIYAGRTWHGMLAGKIVKPPTNANYYTLSGDANACIRSLLTKVGLTDVLTGRTTSAGISVNYQFERFCNAYDGLLKMLASANAVLRIERHDGITELWAEPRTTITDEADSDLMDFSITDSVRVPNHLVCAGEGELQGRVVVDLYADSSGNVSQTQTLTGVDEIALLYNYNNADAAELIAEGTKELQSYQLGGGADLQVNNKGDWHVGDKIQVRDNRTGLVITSTIAKKIVKVKDGILSVDYEIGVASAKSYNGSSTSEQSYDDAVDNGGYQFFTEKGVFGTDYEADWFLVKVDKSKIKISINQNNDNYSNAWEATSNAFDWLSNHDEVDMAHNCNYSGGETTSAVEAGHYAMRYEGVNYAGGVDEPQNRPRLAFDSNAQEFKWYAGGVNVATIPANYDYVFACSDMLIINGNVQSSFNEGGWDAQRAAFGWDDSFWYVFYSEGRNPLNRGLQLPYIAALLHEKFGVKNAVNLDGGGSVCCAANIPQPMKINGYVMQGGSRGENRPTTFNMNYRSWS